MNTNHRFNRDEISSILKRAAELEHKDNVDEEGEGLTLRELQQVSREVGIDPKYVQRALDELQNSAQQRRSNIFGGPFSYNISESAEQIADEEVWEEIVSEIRRIHGGIGKTSKLGNTFEWEQRKREVGYIQIFLSPKKDHTKISINANYGYYASMIYAFTGGFGLLFLIMLFDEWNLPFITQIIAAVSGTMGLLGIARLYLSTWMDKKRKTYGKLINRFQEILGAGQGKESSLSIAIPEADGKEIPDPDTATSRHKEKQNRPPG